MAERGRDQDAVEQVVTPVSEMHITRFDPLHSRVKREAISPTGQTPMAKRSVRAQFSSRKQLRFSPNREPEKASSSAPPVGPWTNNETKALLEFLLFHRGPGTTWCGKNCGTEFWIAAARFVQSRTSTELRRTALSCRSKVLARLMKQFRDPVEALQVLNSHSETHSVAPALHYRDACTQADFSREDITSQMMTLLSTLPESQQPDVVCELMQYLAPSSVTVPHDFIGQSLVSMQRLQQAGRSNVLAGLAKALGTMRSNDCDSLMPISRMPVGLIEYAVDFFTSKKVMSCPKDYKAWCETMYCLFGTKWSKIHGGPAWSVEAISQEGSSEALSYSRNPLDARVNVPAPSARTIQREIAASGYPTDASIQVLVLEEANKAHPGVWWWIKGDGCDITSGLGESVKHIWSGDVDLGDGKLQALHDEYRKRRHFVEGLGLDGRQGQWDISMDLLTLESALAADLDFIVSELSTSSNEYSVRLASGKTAEKTLRKLAWKVDDLSHLSDDGRKIRVDLHQLHDLAEASETSFLSLNVPRRLTMLRERLLTFLQGLYRFRRVPATHLFVLMISPEQRDSKPYALPVQAVPYVSLKHSTCRKLVNNLVSEMTRRGMKVAGFTSNGEFNSLRCTGNTRPLTILQLKANCRAKYGAMGKQKMRAMLSPKPGLVAEEPNPAVSSSLLQEIQQWKLNGVTDQGIFSRLRCRTVPPGHTYTTWKPGKTETETEVLRSILAQLEFAWLVGDYEDRLGIPFRRHLYVPEKHPITKDPFCEREDEAHVLKRIATSTRAGGPSGINLAHYMAALHDPEACLTYTALTGERKQSVTDAAQLFAPTLLGFMEKKGYSCEANYIRVILNWRRACDERGLSELQRCHYNYQMLNYILDDLMPWHWEYDFSYLEVNRSVNSVCGFTRETLNAMSANIEGREFRRIFLLSRNLPPEHPRACSTDDVECLFSVLRDNLGADFTLKRVQYSWRRCCREFAKHIDPSLPFYYFTSAHDRFFESSRPDFSIPSRNEPRVKRVRCREMLSGQAPGRTTLPTAGSRSVRLTYHNVAVNMPPAPQQHSHVTDHTYTRKL